MPSPGVVDTETARLEIVAVVADAEERVDVRVDLVLGSDRTRHGAGIAVRGNGIAENLGVERPTRCHGILGREIENNLIVEVFAAGGLTNVSKAKLALRSTLPIFLPRIKWAV